MSQAQEVNMYLQNTRLMQELHTERQEWHRNNIERACVVLQLRFEIVKQAARSRRNMGDIMYTLQYDLAGPKPLGQYLTWDRPWSAASLIAAV